MMSKESEKSYDSINFKNMKTDSFVPTKRHF